MLRFLKDNLLMLSCFILIVLSIGCFKMYFIGDENSLAHELSLNIVAEVIGILLTVFLIDAVIKKKDTNERKKRESIAFQQLKYPIERHLRLLFDMYKSSITVRPNKSYDKVSYLFDEAYYSEIIFLDFSKRAPIAFETTWFIHLSIETEKFKKAIEKTLDKYSFYMESDVIDLMEKILDSSFIRFIITAPSIYELDLIDGDQNNYNLFAWFNVIEDVRNYTRLILELVEHYNSKVSNDKKINDIINKFWDDDIAPYLGDARINIASN